MTKTPDLNRVSFFKPITGLTFREQLHGKKLVGPEVVDYLRSFGLNKDFVPPTHWERPGSKGANGGNVYAFSLTYLAPQSPGKGGLKVHGFCWALDGFHNHSRSFFTDDVLDTVVGENWYEGDWILVEEAA